MPEGTPAPDGPDGPADPGDPDAPVEAAGLLRHEALVELYRYPPGPAVALPPHAHEGYQLNLNQALPGGVRYRGAEHDVGPDTLALVMPEEVHTPRERDARPTWSSHRALYVGADALRDAAAGLAGHPVGTPTFGELVVDDADMVRRFRDLHRALLAPASALEQDVGLQSFLADLVGRHGGVGPRRTVLAAHRAVRRARDHLHDNLAANVTLAELAATAGVSPFHLTRVFRAELGLPPHAYQVQLRVERAKRLLVSGRTASQAAADVGFCDLSHLSRHFRRLVGVPPGTYTRVPTAG